jgi:hypothetical protein
MAQYRARRNARALNEIASTLFFVFTAIAVVACARRPLSPSAGSPVPADP